MIRMIWTHLPFVRCWIIFQLHESVQMRMRLDSERAWKFQVGTASNQKNLESFQRLHTEEAAKRPGEAASAERERERVCRNGRRNGRRTEVSK